MQWEKIGDDLCLDMAEFYLRSKEAAKLKQMSWLSNILKWHFIVLK